MAIWKHSWYDGTLAGLSFAHLATTLALASFWKDASVYGQIGATVLLVAMIVYNVIIVSHLFTHCQWFKSPLLNTWVSLVNSVNIGQSVEAYRLEHVRNHHRHNNDPKGSDNTTKDWSSTYLRGTNGREARLLDYAVSGSIATMLDSARSVAAIGRLWRVSPRETVLTELASKTPERRARELRQVQLDRTALSIALAALFVLFPAWVLFSLLPAYAIAFALVNVQNYYEHYGAQPADPFANSVSHYGRLYNLLTFNDGYHQEHHLRPNCHWSKLPEAREKLAPRLAQSNRLVSSAPALLRVFEARADARHHDLVPLDPREKERT